MKELVKIDALTAAELGNAYQVESLERTEKEIRYLGEKLELLGKISLVVAYELGRRLAAVKETLDRGQWLPWLEESASFSRRSAYNYMQLYAFFREHPADILEDLSLREAYVMAGLKKAIAPPAGKEGPGPLMFAGKRDEAAEAANMVTLFRRPTISGVKLENHRVENIRGRVYVYRKDVGTISPALDFFMGIPQGLPETDWLEYQKGLVIATELYLEKLEHYEKTGLVEPPEDRRIMKVVERVEKKAKGGR